MYRMAQAGHKRIVIAAPRGFGKSVVLSKIFPLYQICEGTAKGILVISDTATLAEHWLREIKGEIETNPWLIGRYGNMVTDKWSNSHIICKRLDGSKVQIMARGSGAQIRGYHPDLVIVDDIENDEEIKSSDQRIKKKEWFDKAVLGTLDENAQLVMVGTILHPFALLQEVLQRDGWVTKKFQAIQPDGTSLWPEKKPIEWLESKRREIGDTAFRSEFQNDPIVSENPIFVQDWFSTYDSEGAEFKAQEARGLYTVMAIDPAISKKETADYTAIVVLSASFDPKANFYIRKGGAVRGHWTIAEQVTQVFRLYDKFKVRKLIVEVVAYQQALVDEIQRYAKDHRKNVEVHPYTPDKDKERRCHAVASVVQEGRVFFDPSDPAHKLLVDECVVFPTGDHDDYVDALTNTLTYAKQWEGRKRFGKFVSTLAENWA